MTRAALSPLIFFVCGCTLTEWGQVAQDTAAEAGPVFTDPTTYSGGLWTIIGGAVAVAVAVFRKSLARGFGRAVVAAKSLVGR